MERCGGERAVMLGRKFKTRVPAWRFRRGLSPWLADGPSSLVPCMVSPVCLDLTKRPLS